MNPLNGIERSIVLISKLRDIAEKMATAELRLLVADLSNALADAKIDNGELRRENADLNDEVRRLKEAAVLKASGKPKLVFGATSLREKRASSAQPVTDRNQE